jgi:hypothetical protein
MTPFLLLAGTIVNPERNPKLFSKHKMYCFLDFGVFKIRVCLTQKQAFLLKNCSLVRFDIKRLKF